MAWRLTKGRPGVMAIAASVTNVTSSSIWAVLLLLPLLLFCAVHGSPSGTLQSSHPAAAPGDQLARHISRRCRGARPGWCGPFYQQQPLAAREPPAYNVTCPGACNGVGVCNAQLGICDCPAGWSGPDCRQPQKRPCTNWLGGYAGPGTQPSSHIKPDGRDQDWKEPGWTASRCAGVCDDDIAACYCDGEKYGRIPAPPGSPAGTPPIRRGRPLNDLCKPSTDEEGRETGWGDVPWEELYGPQGWCMSDTPVRRCDCHIEGWAGPFCDEPIEHTCPNQCSGVGECQLGFCKCRAGRWGTDCAQRVEGEPALPQEPAVLATRPWLAGHANTPPAASSPAPGATRRRPLIYVYDMPPEFATRMLQYRIVRPLCTWRSFDAGNASSTWYRWGYGLETALHEMLLISPHRTLDPEEADFFYVPAYITCLLWPVQGWADYPWYFQGQDAPRVKQGTMLTLLAKRWVQQQYPYWNRTNGANHIFLFNHDEGACWAPRELFYNAIILTHWGRTGANQTSGTSYGWDNYSRDVVDPLLSEAIHPAFKHKNASWTALIKPYECYQPVKDLVIPFLKHPAQYPWSPLLGAQPRKRTFLLYFRGDVGVERPAPDPGQPIYSRGIRQRLYQLCREQDWAATHQILIGTPNDIPGDYSEQLACSRFCVVVPGDGYSARAEDAILHGCVPVVIMDDVEAVFESIIDWQQFSIRVREDSLESLPDILNSITPQQYARMRLHLLRVMHRFAWLSHPLLQQRAEALMNGATAAGSQSQGDASSSAGSGKDMEWEQQQMQEEQWEREEAQLLEMDEQDAQEFDGSHGKRRLHGWVRSGAIRLGAAWKLGSHSAPPKPGMDGTQASQASSRVLRAGSGAGRHAQLRRGFALRGSMWEDDALGTLMQWLYAKL